jgi:branched-chain amino acid transport system permease protein
VILALPQFVIAIFALVVIGLVYYLIKHTRLGWAIQATAMGQRSSRINGDQN